MLRSVLVMILLGGPAFFVVADEPDGEQRDRPRPQTERPRDGDRGPDARRSGDPDRPSEADRRHEPQRRPDSRRGGDPDRSNSGPAPRFDRPQEARQDDSPRARVIDALRHRLGQLRQELGDNADGQQRRDEVRRQIGQTERELDEVMRDGDHRPQQEHTRRHDPPHERDQAVERIEHLHIAAEHLTHAGLHDIAHRVREHAEEIERDVRGREHRDDDEAHRMMREVHEQLDHLRREVNELREQLGRLSRDR